MDHINAEFFRRNPRIEVGFAFSEDLMDAICEFVGGWKEAMPEETGRTWHFSGLTVQISQGHGWISTENFHDSSMITRIMPNSLIRCAAYQEPDTPPLVEMWTDFPEKTGVVTQFWFKGTKG